MFRMLRKQLRNSKTCAMIATLAQIAKAPVQKMADTQTEEKMESVFAGVMGPFKIK